MRCCKRGASLVQIASALVCFLCKVAPVYRAHAPGRMIAVQRREGQTRRAFCWRRLQTMASASAIGQSDPQDWHGAPHCCCCCDVNVRVNAPRLPAARRTLRVSTSAYTARPLMLLLQFLAAACQGRVKLVEMLPFLVTCRGRVGRGDEQRVH